MGDKYINEYHIELMEAIDRLDVEELRIPIEQSAIEILSTENVITLLIAADLYRFYNLKNACIECLVKNSQKLETIPDWGQIQDRNDLLGELYWNWPQDNIVKELKDD